MMSPNYFVYVPSLWLTEYEVKAKSKEEAIEKVRKDKDANPDVHSSLFAEYERELSPEEWPWYVKDEKKRK
jgi:hypothetical protein